MGSTRKASARGGIRRTKSTPTYHLHLQTSDHPPPLEQLLSSIPWHGGFAFLMPAFLVVLQLHFQGSSPLHTHPINTWTFILCLSIYSLSLAFYIKSQISISYASFANLSSHIALISGSFASAALLSLFVTPSLQPLVFVISSVLLFLHYFSHNINTSFQKAISYVKNKSSGIIIGNVNDNQAIADLPV